MKKLGFLLFIIGALSFSSCRYEDGPKLTFRSAKARVSNVWHMYRYFYNGEEQTDNFNVLFPNWTLDIKKDETYILSYSVIIGGTNSEKGQWEFMEDGKKLNFRANSTGTNIWTITRLKNDELWAEQTDNSGKLVQYRLRP